MRVFEYFKSGLIVFLVYVLVYIVFAEYTINASSPLFDFNVNYVMFAFFAFVPFIYYSNKGVVINGIHNSILALANGSAYYVFCEYVAYFYGDALDYAFLIIACVLFASYSFGVIYFVQKIIKWGTWTH